MSDSSAATAVANDESFDWAVTKFRFSMVIAELELDGLKELAAVIEDVVAVGQEHPEHRPYLISLTGVDQP